MDALREMQGAAIELGAQSNSISDPPVMPETARFDFRSEYHWSCRDAGMPCKPAAAILQTQLRLLRRAMRPAGPLRA